MGAARPGGLGGGGKSGMTINQPSPQQPQFGQATPSGLMNLLGRTAMGGQVSMPGGISNRGLEAAPQTQANPMANYGSTQMIRSAPGGLANMLAPPAASQPSADATRTNYLASVQSMLRPSAPSNYVGPQPNITPEQNQAMQAGWQQDRERQMREAQLARMRGAQSPQYSFGGYGGGNYGDPRFQGILAMLGRGR